MNCADWQHLIVFMDSTGQRVWNMPACPWFQQAWSRHKLRAQYFAQKRHREVRWISVIDVDNTTGENGIRCNKHQRYGVYLDNTANINKKLSNRRDSARCVKRPPKVIRCYANQRGIYDFLLALYSDLTFIFKRCWDITPIVFIVYNLQEIISRWDTRTWRDVSSYMVTYLSLNYDIPVVTCSPVLRNIFEVMRTYLMDVGLQKVPFVSCYYPLSVFIE